MTEQQKQAALLRDALIVLDQIEQYLDSRTAHQTAGTILTREMRLLRDVTQILNRGCGWGKLPPGSVDIDTGKQPA